MAAKKKPAKPKARTTTKKPVKAKQSVKAENPIKAKKPTKAKKPAKAKQVAPETSQFATSDGGPWGKCFLPRTNGERRYWLVKSEPETFSWNDLLASPNQTTRWDGVRNFAARNFLRDGMRVGDPVFFYHSSSEPPCIVGHCVVSHAAYPDPTAFDPAHPGFDETTSPATPTWFVVDLRAVEPLAHPVTLARMKQTRALARMALLRIGRLSVTPVTKSEWDAILALSRG